MLEPASSSPDGPGRKGQRHRRAAGLISAFLALASLPVHLFLAPTASHELAALVLSLIAGIYVGFAVRDSRASVIALEALTALAFIAAAALGLWASPWFVPAAYVCHRLWDVAHHRLITTTLPRWYVPFCAIFDWVFALGLGLIWIG